MHKRTVSGLPWVPHQGNAADTQALYLRASAASALVLLVLLLGVIHFPAKTRCIWFL